MQLHLCLIQFCFPSWNISSWSWHIKIYILFMTSKEHRDKNNLGILQKVKSLHVFRFSISNNWNDHLMTWLAFFVLFFYKMPLLCQRKPPSESVEWSFSPGLFWKGPQWLKQQCKDSDGVQTAHHGGTLTTPSCRFMVSFRYCWIHALIPTVYICSSNRQDDVAAKKCSTNDLLKTVEINEWLFSFLTGVL